MKANKKILIIVLIAALLLVGILVALILLPKGGDDSKDNAIDEGVDMRTSIDESGLHQAIINTKENGEIENNSYGTLVKYNTADVVKLHVENKSGSFDVTSYTPVDEDGKSEATVYTLEGYEDFDLQAGIADSIANDAADLEFTKVISLDGKNSSDYGFDSPTATVDITYSDDTTAKLIVGDTAPQNMGVYVKFGTLDTIYFVAVDSVDSFSYGVNDLISLTINDSPTDSNDNNPISVELGGRHLSEKVVFEANLDAEISSSYKITAPQARYAGEKATSNIVGGIRGLYADSVVMANPSDSQLKELGLDEPYAEIKADYPDTTVELIASEPDGDNYVNLMVKGGKVVYKIASDKVAWSTVKYEELLNEYVLYPNMTSLSNVIVKDGSNTYDYELSSVETTTTDDEGNETTSVVTTVLLDKADIETGYFSTFYQNITMTTLADYETEEVTGDLAFRVTYQYNTLRESDTVSFYQSDSGRYVAVLNGTVVGHVYKSGINKIINQTATLAKNEQVESNF